MAFEERGSTRWELPGHVPVGFDSCAIADERVAATTSARKAAVSDEYFIRTSLELM
jgi:hypothetical protein